MKKHRVLYAMAIAFLIEGKPADAVPPPLPVEKVFHASFTEDGETLLLSIKKDYFLYQDSIRIYSVSGPQNASPSLILPATKIRKKYLESSRLVYDRNVSITLPKPLLRQCLRVDFQGCSRANYCYPPQSKTVCPKPEKPKATHNNP